MYMKLSKTFREMAVLGLDCLFINTFTYFKGGLNRPPPHSSYIQKPRTIRVNHSMLALLFYDENHPMKGGQLRPEPVSTNERSCCITSHQSDDGTENNELWIWSVAAAAAPATILNVVVL